MLTSQLDASLTLNLDVPAIVDQDVFAVFDPTVAPFTFIQTADVSPPRPSNIVEVRKTSFNDIITQPCSLIDWLMILVN